MGLPLFSPEEDPGPSFLGLLERSSFGLPEVVAPSMTAPAHMSPHGTTVVAVRHRDGVVMAGDRRATSGNLISRRDMEKVFPADRHSGVAISGSAGMAMEMVRLFQLQLEHYEKVEGKALSLVGKANQLSQMLRGHLPMALQGFIVIPLFAGYDDRQDVGRLFEFDPSGGRYEDREFAATGSGSLHASTVVKLRYREGMSEDEAVDVVVEALFQAADEDSATGGPDPIRGIYPVVASITSAGFQRLGDEQVAERTAVLLESLAGGRAD
ncbi:MAG: proteasome subunit beta [Actinomycetota bacterium]|nr:proteasome subunit beta [Actinomycetota bacterium]MED5220007.1 proteasome subunit beta [Actinomycetota bacterium]MED5232927.1 proteasome subunit beta [Actinomycetota bacterium]